MPAILPALGFVSSAKGVVGKVGGLFGGGQSAEKESQRSLAANVSKHVFPVNETTIARYKLPRPNAKGEFFVDARDGQVYAAKSSGGFVVYSSPWASQVTAAYRRHLTGQPETVGSQVERAAALSAGAIPGGVGFLMLAGIAVAFILFRGRR